MSDFPWIEIIIKSSMVIVVAIVARNLIKRQLPSTRHLVLLSALFGVLLVPVFTQLTQFRTTVPLPATLVPEPASKIAPNANVNGDTTPTISLKSSIEPSISIGALLTGLWVLGAAAVLGRYAIGLASLCGTRGVRANSSLASGLSVDTGAIARQGGIAVPFEVRIATDPNLKTAMTWGLRKPIILLPADASTWTSTRLEMIMLHEFAHLRRKDFASQMLAEISCAVYWFNPIVWLSARAMREDAELAADEAVISAGIRPSDYASELLQIAATLNPRNRKLNRVGISTMTNPKIESRLKAILSSTKTDRGNTLINVLATLSISAVAVAGIASLKLQEPAKTPDEQQKLAMSRIKQVATATYMYATDFDDVLPYIENAKQAQKVIWPYIKDMEVFKSPRAGADFRYNANIAGVTITSIPSPAEAIMWYEFTPAGVNPVVAFVDGHARVVLPDKMAAFKSGLNQKYPRKSNSKPVRGIGGE